MTGNHDASRALNENGRIPCEEIQGLLFGYMSRELGEGRSDLVREHIRKCADCQAAAADMQDTMSVLQGASEEEAGIPRRLSDDRRARIAFSFTHPVLDWMYQHHILVSAVMTLVVLVLLGLLLIQVRIWRSGPLDPGVPVKIGPHGADGPATGSVSEIIRREQESAAAE